MSALTLETANPIACAVIYARVSHDKRGTGRSVEEQVTVATGQCEREAWPIAATIVDNDTSASPYATKLRDGWDDVKALIASGRVDNGVLVTWAQTRATRDQLEGVTFQRLCATHNVRLAYEGQLLDMNNSTDVLNNTFHVAIGQKYASDIKQATRRAMNFNAAAGRPHGRRMYGYRRSYDPTTGAPTGTQTIDEVEAAVVREAGRRFLDGESARRIAADFNQRGVPSSAGKTWDYTAIRKMLTRPGYAGLRQHNGDLVQGNWPAILDAETWTQLQTRFSDPARRMNRDRADLTHVLSGVARCGVCGARMAWESRGDRSPAYVCRGGLVNGKRLSGSHLSRRADDLEGYVVHVVLGKLDEPDIRTQLAAAGDDDPAVAEAGELAKALRAQLTDVVAEVRGLRMSAQMASEIETDLRPRLAAAEREAQRVSPVPLTVHDVAGRAQEKWAQWEVKGDVARQRDLIRSVADVTVLPVDPGTRRRFDPSKVRIDFKF